MASAGAGQHPGGCVRGCVMLTQDMIATAAVSTRSLSGPKPTGLAPAATNNSTSFYPYL